MPIVLIVVCAAFLMFPMEVHAYIGPGLGLGFIGVIFGVLFSVALGLIGIFWYPLKLLFGKTTKRA